MIFKLTVCLTYYKLTKGASGARGDDTKSLKGSALDWITPKGQNLVPPLARNVKIDRGFNHERTGALLCPAGLDWSNPECVMVTFRFLLVSLAQILTLECRTKTKLIRKTCISI